MHYLHSSSTTENNKNFYADLKELILAITLHTVLMLTGNVNDRLSNNCYETYPRIIGPLAITENTNDYRMIDFCEATASPTLIS